MRLMALAFVYGIGVGTVAALLGWAVGLGQTMTLFAAVLAGAVIGARIVSSDF